MEKQKTLKIRIFDKTRLNWEAAADFVVEDRNILMKKVGKDIRFSCIKREKWDDVEIHLHQKYMERIKNNYEKFR